MRFSEIIFEENDNDDNEESQTLEQMKIDLVDYLTSLAATGLRSDIKTSKIVDFMARLGYDINDAQISDLLVGTAFSADPERVKVNQLDPAIQGKANRSRDFDKRKVTNMARKELDRDI